MVSIPDAIECLFPFAISLRDYVVADDGSGPRITAWNLPDPQPTPEQLAAVTDAQVNAAKAAKSRQSAVTAIDARADEVGRVVRAALRLINASLNQIRQQLNLPTISWQQVRQQLAQMIANGQGDLEA